jgi:translation initiation factor IF-2
MSEKKATLIKRVGNAKKIESQEEEKKEITEPTATSQKIEKKKVVVVKKRVVKVKPQVNTTTATMQSTAGKSSITKVDENKKPSVTAAKATDTKKPATTGIKKKTLHVSTKLKGHTFAKGQSPLHTGPVIIRSTELPPVPNQGQTAKAHAEWQTQNPNGTVESKVLSAGPRVAGTVGGKPVGGRPANRGGYNRSARPGDTRTGYQGNNNRNGTGGYAGGSTGGSTGGYNRPAGNTGGYNRPAGSTGGYNRSAGSTGGYNRPAGSTGGYNRPAGNTGGYN